MIIFHQDLVHADGRVNSFQVFDCIPNGCLVCSYLGYKSIGLILVKSRVDNDMVGFIRA
jgi:hypothetical protein